MPKIGSREKALPGNLPVPLSTFIGREREIGDVKRLVAASRLVTLTGAGGSGKTRLAIQVTSTLLGEFEDGIWFAEFASIFDPGLIPQTLASTLNLRQGSGQSVLDVLIHHLSSRQTLLIFDNCEHLISACAAFTETLLQNCPDLKILATSREVLGLIGEVSWLVPSLSLPGSQPWSHPSRVPDALKLYEASESVQLFVKRAMENVPGFQLTPENGAWVAEICRRLDGMPLAIELAAARVRSLSVQQIAQRLDDRFHLLTGGSRTAASRQQTLLSTLDWSYALLSETEQKVLQRLSVFVGGATLQAAEVVCQGETESLEVLDILSHLVDKSLVKVESLEPGETRYGLLETVRQYALQKLSEANDTDAVRDRHLQYFVQWAETAEKFLDGVQQLEWIKRYDAERDNLRAGLEWCHANPKWAEQGLRLTAACGQFWRHRGYLSEARSHVNVALEDGRLLKDTELYARVLYMGAVLAYRQSDYPATRLLGLTFWRTLNAKNKTGLAAALDLMGELATEEGDFPGALKLLQEALQAFREANDLRGIGDVEMQLGWAYMRMGAYDQVAGHLEAALALFREVGYATWQAFTLAGLGELAIRQNDYGRAVQFLEESLALHEQHANTWGVAICLGSLGWMALRQHDFQHVREYLGKSLSIRTEIGDQGGLAWCLEKLAEVKYQESERKDAVKIFACAEAIRASLGSKIDPVDQPEYDRIVSELQVVLGEDEFAAAWAVGKTMPVTDVIELALSGNEAQGNIPTVDKENYEGLTAREREVAAWIAQGKSNREIAEAMTVGVKTIETYVTRILNKLGFESRVQIATWAIEKGLK